MILKDAIAWYCRILACRAESVINPAVVESPCCGRISAGIDSCPYVVHSIECDVVWQSGCLNSATESNLRSLVGLGDVEVAESNLLISSCSCSSQECEVVVATLLHCEYMVLSSSSIVGSLHAEVCNLLECGCICLGCAKHQRECECARVIVFPCTSLHLIALASLKCESRRNIVVVPCVVPVVFVYNSRRIFTRGVVIEFICCPCNTRNITCIDCSPSSLVVAEIYAVRQCLRTWFVFLDVDTINKEEIAAIGI